MDHHPRHTQRFGHQTGMLPSGSTKTLKRIRRDIMAALYADFLDRIGHILHSDIQKPLRHILHITFQAMISCQSFESRDSRASIQRQCARCTKNSREIIRTERTQYHIAICNGQRPAAAVAGWPRIGAGAFRPHLEPAITVTANRTATSRHRVDVHHRCPHPHAGHIGFKTALKFAREMTDIGGGATHVKANQLIKTCVLASLHHANDPSSGTR